MREKFKDKEYWLALFGVISYYCMGISNALHPNNTTYALEQINQYDSSLFANNFAVYTGGMSARFFMNFIVGLGMKIVGGSWIAVAVPLIYLGVVVLAFATVEIIFNISEKYRLFLVSILAFFLRNSINTGFPGWGSFELASIGMGTAYALAMLAFSQVVGRNKKWNTAWIILAIATLCHIHEGLWGFCLLFILFVCQAVEEKSLGTWRRHWAFVVFAIVLGICVLPGIFGEPSGMSPREFVDIYAYYRTPHHLVPSEWGLREILKYLAVLVGVAAIRIETLYFTDKGKCKSFYLESGLAIVSWLIAICITYIFTEVIPVPAIVTMYIPKYLKYIGILSQIWCIKCIRDWTEKNEILIAGLLTVVVCLASAQRILCIVAFYGVFMMALLLWKKYAVNEMQYLLPIGVLGLVIGFRSEKVIDAVVIMFFLYGIIFWNRVKWVQKVVHNIVFVVILSILMLMTATKDKVWTISDGTLTRVTANSYLVKRIGEELYDLAITFENTTETDEMFISDPYNKMNFYFQLGAQRNSYVNEHNVPAAQSQIKEWYDRIMATQDLFSKEDTDIYKIMKNAGINYILVNNENYEKFDLSDIFMIRNISSNDQYRIYEIR